MSRIDELFQNLRKRNETALMPFVTAGDPDLDFTALVLREFAKRGCHLCEVGIPYSDPIADGPVVQASYTRALARGIKVRAIIEQIAATAPELSMPLVTMVSYAIVHRYGAKRYVSDASKAGAAGIIVPDLPVEEAEALRKVCSSADFSLIQLVTPTTPRTRALRIAETSSGFLYYVSVAGITGERTELPPQLRENVTWLREQTDLPICIGFGISQPQQVELLRPVADGLIVGSAFMRRVATAADRSRQEVLADVGQFAESLLAALRPRSSGGDT